MMDIVHDNTSNLMLEIPSHEADSEDQNDDVYYLPVLATQHEVPLPVDFKKQR